MSCNFASKSTSILSQSQRWLSYTGFTVLKYFLIVLSDILKYFLIFPRKHASTFHTNLFQWSEDDLHELSNLFSGKNKTNIC